MRQPRLRAVVGVGSAVLTLLALACALTLAWSTSVMSAHSRQIASATQSMRAAEGIQVDLLAYGRESDLAVLTKDPKQELARAKTETKLLETLAEARRYAQGDPAQVALLDRVRDEVQAYLVTRRLAESKSSSVPDIIVAASGALQAALDTTGHLVSDDLARVLDREQNIARWDLLGNIVGVGIATLVLLGFCAALGVMQRMFYRPLVGLTRSMSDFAEGNRDARAPTGGPAEIQVAADTFNALVEKAGRQRRDQLTFLAGVAHDLRNPLAAMRTVLDLIESGRMSDEEKRARGMTVLRRQVTRLERMVGDFLDANRIEAGQLELLTKPLDLREIAQHTVELYRTMSLAHQVVAQLPDVPVLVECDAERIEQVLNNLVSNAIKYSPLGGKVVVALSRNSEAVLSVSDSGIGIAPADQKSIFEPFHRTGASRETAAGVGLGLSVTQRIVMAHGGTIEVESAPDVGSTFRVHLPLAPAALPHPPTSEEAPAVH